MSSPTTIALLAQGGSGWLGGLQYTAHLIEALARLPAPERAALRVLLIAGSDQLAGLHEARNQVDAVIERLPEPSVLERWQDRLRRRLLGWSDPWTDRALRKLGVDFVYPHHVRDAHARSYRCAGWLPDFQHEHMPELFSASELTERRTRFAEVARYADRVVLSSRDAQKHFGELYPDALSRTAVLPFPSCPQASWFAAAPADTLARYHLPQRYLLVCNQFWRHKNHAQLWQALAELAKENVRPDVVLTGHTHDYRHPRYFDELLASAHTAGIAGQLHFLGVVPRIDQVQLMRAAVAMVQPSRFEGWSTVVEDARAIGCPIVLSDLPVHREQAPPDAHYFALDNAVALAGALAQVWAERGVPRDEDNARRRNADGILAFGRRFAALARGELET